MRFLAEHLFHDLLDLGHAGHAADQNHLVDFGGLEAGILKCLFARAPGARDEIIHQALQFGARELHSEMLRAGLVRRDKRQIDFGLLRRRQLNFRLLRGLFQALECELVVAQIDTLFFLELVGKVVDELHIEVFAAQERVAVCRLHLEDAVANLQYRNIKGATTEIVNRDGFCFRLLLQTVRKRARRRLIDDAQNLKAGNFAGVLGGLALGVIKVGRDGDDGLRNSLTELGFRRLFHLLQNEC